MGHTVYYRTEIAEWNTFIEFMKEVCDGLGLETLVEGDSFTVFPDCLGVEPLEIPKKGEGFAKTNRVEPCHSLYRLILYSLSSFGSVSVWED